MRYALSCGAIITGLVFALPALADDRDTCANASGDVAIAACTRAIASRKYKGHNLAVLYFNRGIEYQHNGDLDRAIADYNEAIRLDPKYLNAYNNRGFEYQAKGDLDRAVADYDMAIKLDPRDVDVILNRCRLYNAKKEYDRAIAEANKGLTAGVSAYGKYVAFDCRGEAYHGKGDNDRAIADYTMAIESQPKRADPYEHRGNAYQGKGDKDRAIADYSEAIRLDPKDADAYYNRGIANLYGGSLPKALADLNQASALDPKDAYTALWLDIVRKRSNLAGRLPQEIAQLDMTKWPAPVIRLYMGQMTPEAVLAAADDQNAYKQKGQVCEANFYSGELALQQGKKDDAAGLFRSAANDCPKNFTEWAAANEELKALGATP